MVAYNWGCLLLHERSVDKYAAIGPPDERQPLLLAPLSLSKGW